VSTTLALIVPCNHCLSLAQVSRLRVCARACVRAFAMVRATDICGSTAPESATTPSSRCCHSSNRSLSTHTVTVPLDLACR
jgi:hypothetical protein